MKHVTKQAGTLLEQLQALYPDSSKTTLRSWIKEGRIAVEGMVEKIASKNILEGKSIELLTKKKFIESDLAMLYQDEHIVVIDKPSGLLSVSTDFEKSKTAHAILKRHFSSRRVHVVHRLDQDTSGVMMFALSEEAYVNLKVAFEKHEVHREYIAIVEGKLQAREGTWQSYLYEDAQYVVKETLDQTRGQLATTHYRVQRSTKKFSRLLVRLETGRKNQIRVHCQAALHPIVGDVKYSSTCNPLKRLGLHAYKLMFKHPITQKPMTIYSPVPMEFDQLVSPK